MTEIAPGWSIEVGDSTAHHWVGACRNIVMVFAYAGSHDDVQHVFAGAEMLQRVGQERAERTRLLFVLPPSNAKPPDSRVRNALAQVARRVETNVDRVAVVVAGTGFAAAVHRGAVTGLMALMRPKIPIKVVSDLRAGLAHVLGSDSEVLTPLVQFCEECVQGKHPPAAVRR